MMWMQAGPEFRRGFWPDRRRGDAVAGKVMGFPSTGLFGLFDLVGIDLMPHVSSSMAGNLPKTDSYHQRTARIRPDQEDDRDRLYRPQGQGRFLPHDQERRRAAKEAVDLKTGDYHAVQPVSIRQPGCRLADRKTGLKTLLSVTTRARPSPGACWPRPSPIRPTWWARSPIRWSRSMTA
jgi:3-hydroxyacyl-CoA dehydrogenase